MSDLAYRALLSALDGLNDGRYVTIDLIRDECDAAGLSSAERGAALTNACRAGYLRSFATLIPEVSLQPVQVSVKSKHPAAKGRHVLLYRRTDLDIPEHPCGVNVVESQQDSWDNGSSKTAPGVASTTTGSLAHSEAAKPHGRTCIT